MEFERTVNGKKQVVYFTERRGLPRAMGPEEVHAEFLSRCGPELPGTKTAAEIGMERVAVEKAAVALRAQRDAWALFDAMRFSGNAKVDPVLKGHLGLK
jgi:hypothetical protein